MTTATPAKTAKVAATITAESISITLDGRYRSFPRNTEQGLKLIEAVKKVPQDLDEIRLIADIAAYVASKTFGRVILDDRDNIRLDGAVVDYIAAGTFKRVLEEGFSVEPLVRFIENVAQNPDKSVAADLYKFLEKGRLPITEDGKFHAFKRVGDDYLDLHSRSVLYTIGSTVSMPRENCDPNRNSTCSRGLHACSFDYLAKFHGGRGRVLTVEIDPKNVTAIPNDYNDSKLRCCEMDVLGEVPEDEAKAHYSSAVARRTTPVTTAQVDPEDATDATAEDGVTATATDAQLVGGANFDAVARGSEPATPVDWVARGRAAGLAAGREDGANGYDYDTATDMPSELSGGPDSARRAYTEAYVTAYGEGFTQGQDEAGDGGQDDDDQDGDLDDDAVFDPNGFPISDDEKAKEIAALWGKEDMEALIADAGSGLGLLDIEPSHGARHDHVIESTYYANADTDEVETLYVKAAHAVLNPAWLAEAKRLGALDGRDWAQGDTAFDADPTNGSNYDSFDTLEDDEGEYPFISAYNQAFTLAYSARFAEQNG